MAKKEEKQKEQVAELLDTAKKARELRAEAKEGKVTLEEVNRKLNNIEAKLRRRSINWKRVCKAMPDMFLDGRLKDEYGFVRRGLLAGMAIVSSLVLAVSTMADITVFQAWDSDSTYGTFKVTSDENGTATLTVDAISTSSTNYSGDAVFSDNITLASGKDLRFAADSTSDIGTSTAEAQDAFFDGTIHTDVLDVDETAGFIGVATFTAIPIFNGGVDINEDADIDFDSNDEELTISTSAEIATGGYMVEIECNKADVAAQGYLLALSHTDSGDADGDFFICRDNSQADTLFLIAEDGNTTIAGTLALTGAATFSSTMTLTGNLTLTADIDIDGGDITCPADLTITPTGNEVIIDGGLSIGDTTQVGDNDLSVAGTSALDGNVTCTADLAVNGGDITATADLNITPAGDDMFIICDDVSFTNSTASTATRVYVYAGEGTAATLYLYADQADNADDMAAIQMQADGELSINGTSATNEVLVVDLSTGNLQIDGDIDIDGGDITAPADLSITPTGDDMWIVCDDVNVTNSTASTDTRLYVRGGEGKTAAVYLWADNGDEADDQAAIQFDASGSLNLLGTSGTNIYAAFDASTGNLQLDGDIDIDGGDVTCPADLLITPTGGQVHINGGVDIGGTSAVADNSLLVGDNLTVTGLLNIDDTALSVTNAQPVTITDGAYILTGTGQADNYTNSITVAAPTTAGDIVILTVSGTSSNLVGIADSGNVNLSAAWVGDNEDTLTLYGQTTSKWIELSRSDN